MDPLQMLNSVGAALLEAFNMAWEVLWPLILGCVGCANTGAHDHAHEHTSHATA